MIYRQNGDDRPFVFSTPRLNNEKAVELNLPFNHPIYDELARLRTVPEPLSTIMEKVGFTGPDKDLFLSFLEPASSYQGSNPIPQEKRIRWRYLGHACVLVESPNGCNVLIDPVVAYDDANGIPRYTIRDLPEKLDYVVLTHNHSDHVAIETLLALRWKIGTIIVPASGGSLADPSLKLMLKAIGFKNVIELGAMDSVEHNDLEITAIPFLGEHGDLDIRTKSAWLVRINDKKLLFAADSNNLDPSMYDHIGKIVGDIDSLFIGMECQGAPMSWVYGPLLPLSLDRKKDQGRRLNGSDFPRAMKVVESLKCKKVYVYAMGAEPWMQYITSIDPSEDTPPIVNSNAFIKECNERGTPALRLYGQYELYES
jgi:L-ascorbate metabolism protein UlaG (beta-lactamase superfamily)